MTSDQLAADIDRLLQLLPDLAALLPEPVADPTSGTSSRHKVSGSPAPWHAEAAAVLFDVHAGARALEDKLLEIVTGRTPRGRGSSDANTRAALEAIPDLAAAAGEPHDRYAAGQVARWLRCAEEIRDVDARDKWTPVPTIPGHAPPPCPYCDTYAMRMNRRTGVVRCTNPECRDPEGHRPAARMEYGRLSGQGMLVFRDGRQIVYRLEQGA